MRGHATVDEFKQPTTDEISAIPCAVLHRVFPNMLKQLHLCKSKQGVI